MKKRRAWRWVLGGFAGIVAALAVAFVVMSYALQGRPIEAPGWITDKVEARINASMTEAGSVRLGRIVIMVDDAGVPRIRLRDVRIYDAGGALVAALNDAGAALSIAALQERKIEPETLSLSGAQIVLRRRADGQFDLSFGGGGKGPSTGNIVTALNEIDEGFGRAPLKTVRKVTATDLTVTLEDARSRRIWTVTGGRLDLTHDGDQIELSMTFEVFNGTEEMATTQMSLSKKKGSPVISFGARFANAAAADIALQSPALAFLQVLDAPISGALRGQTDAEGNLGAFTGTLEIGKGALQPTPETRGVGFDGARAYFTYDPAEERLGFSELSVRTEAARVRASGQAFLREFVDGWPRAFVGQFALADMRAEPGTLMQEAVSVESGAVDLRLRLDPFTVEVGQLMLMDQGDKLLGRGKIAAVQDGWSVAADLSVDRIDAARVLALWPQRAVPKTRAWLEQNIIGGELSEAEAALRIAPGSDPRVSVGWNIRDAEVRYLKTLPPVTGAQGYARLEDDTFTLVVEEGQVAAPQGGSLQVGGTSIRIPDITLRPARMNVALRTSGSAEASLALVDLPPFNVLRNSTLTADVAEGRAEMQADIGFPMVQKLQLEQVSYAIAGTLRDITSDTLTAPRRFSADLLRLTASPASVEVSGKARVGRAQGEGRWQRLLGESASGDPGSSDVTGVVQLNQAFLEEFGIDLPAGSVSGEGRGQFTLTLAQNAAPSFELTSDLNAMALRLDPLGWSKPRAQKGALAVAGRLGESPEITSLTLDAAGLTASGGRVTLREDGALDVASFEQLRVGDWLEVPIRLVGRGPDQPLGIEISGGRMDMRGVTSGSSSTGATTGGPITAQLDRLVISDGISLSPFTGSFSQRGGFNGDFSARVNGRTSVTGQVAPSRTGSVIRLRGTDAGGALRDAGVFSTARGGALDLTLTPVGPERTYDGRMKIEDTKIVGASPVAELLSALSIVGLLDQLSGPGIRFTNVDARFRIDPQRMTLTKSSAIGPSLGVSLDGIYDLESHTMDMQGVLSPVYFLNGIGQIFSRNREGLFGFNFTMRGDADDPRVQVNPLSILTPGGIRDIFRRPPPKVPDE